MFAEFSGFRSDTHLLEDVQVEFEVEVADLFVCACQVTHHFEDTFVLEEN